MITTKEAANARLVDAQVAENEDRHNDAAIAYLEVANFCDREAERAFSAEDFKNFREAADAYRQDASDAISARDVYRDRLTW